MRIQVNVVTVPVYLPMALTHFLRLFTVAVGVGDQVYITTCALRKVSPSPLQVDRAYTQVIMVVLCKHIYIHILCRRSNLYLKAKIIQGQKRREGVTHLV